MNKRLVYCREATVSLAKNRIICTVRLGSVTRLLFYTGWVIAISRDECNDEILVLCRCNIILLQHGCEIYTIYYYSN